MFKLALSKLATSKFLFLTGSLWSKVSGGANNISSNVTKVSMPVAIAMFVVAGFMWFFGQGSSQKGKSLMIAITIGGIVVLLSPAIIQALWNIFGGATF